MLSHRLHFATVLILGAIFFAGIAPAQPLSNASLKGAYNVRYLGADVVDGSTDTAVSFSGTITFDGNGGYTVTGQGASKATGGFKLAPSGTYLVNPGGSFYMDNPADPSGQWGLYGGISPATGSIVASGTDTVYTDLLVGVAAGTTASASSLNGKYFISSLEFQNGDITNLTRNTFFSATANGSGSFGDWTIKGTALNLNSAAQSQASLGVAYTMTANGTGTLNIPAPTPSTAAASQLLSGSKILYVSPDGNLFVAGSTTGYDMVVGIKAISGNPNTALSGFYFTGLLENLAAGSDGDGLYGAQGSAKETNGIEIAHQRTNWEFFGTYDVNTAFSFTGFATDGTLASPGFSNYVVGAGGNLVLGSGDGTNYQLNLYVRAPSTSSGSGVYLDPQGIVNAATFVPFTASIAPGEIIALFGSGLTTTTTSAGVPFPTSLGGVQLNVTWKDSTGTHTAQAPLIVVSPTFLEAIVPYGVPSDGSFLNFQLGANSNIVPMYSGATSPGILTQSQNGIGNGSITHADGSLVTSASPAKVGETVVMYGVGLGAVTPAVTDGKGAPTSPLATATTPYVAVDGVAAKVLFAGLTPGYAGLYQLNVTIPSGVTAGQSVSILIETDDADTIQATIPISK